MRETSPAAAAVSKGYSLWATPLPHSYPRLEKTQLSAGCHQHLEYQASDAENKLCTQARVINTFRMLGEAFSYLHMSMTTRVSPLCGSSKGPKEQNPGSVTSLSISLQSSLSLCLIPPHPHIYLDTHGHIPPLLRSLYMMII